MQIQHRSLLHSSVTETGLDSNNKQSKILKEEIKSSLWKLSK